MVNSPWSEPRDYTLKAGKTTLGRHPGNDIVISDESASRLHAEIEFLLAQQIADFLERLLTRVLDLEQFFLGHRGRGGNIGIIGIGGSTGKLSGISTALRSSRPPPVRRPRRSPGLSASSRSGFRWSC